MDFLRIQIELDKLDSYLLSGFVVSEDSQYYSIRSGEKLIAKLRIRKSYPSTYCRQISDEVVVFGYGPESPTSSEEFLQIILDKNKGLIVKRDLYATLPIFYGESNERFILSNDYEVVVQSFTSLGLNQNVLLEALLPNPDCHLTLWNQVKILDERHTLELDVAKKNIIVTPPSPRSWHSSKEAPRSDPTLFKEVFDSHLDNFLHKFQNLNSFAFEVSGGIDSATLPLYFAKKNKEVRPLLGSMVFPGNFGETQDEKLIILSEKTGFQVEKVAIVEDKNYPLSRFNKSYRYFYNFDEIYTEPLEELAGLLQSKGIKTVATGIGGDELFENTLSAEYQLRYGKNELKYRHQFSYPSFITSLAKKKYIEATPSQPPYPLPLLATSLHGANLARNNVYISHDIWPVSPYANVELYDFCQGLPAVYRANKNILRAFHEAFGFPKIIHSPKQNEYFGDLFERSFQSGAYDSMIENICQSSITRQLGLIDTDKLMQEYEALKLEQNKKKLYMFFYIFSFLSTEINLQFAQKRRALAGVL